MFVVNTFSVLSTIMHSQLAKHIYIYNSYSVVVWFTCYSVPLDNQWLVSYSGGTLMT